MSKFLWKTSNLIKIHIYKGLSQWNASYITDLKYLYMSPGFPFTFSLKTECHSSFTVHIISYMSSNVQLLISQDCEDHAILLCSLLLGFGLDAYVCVGTKSKGAVHAWVVTISIEGTVVFWESLNGHRYVWCSREIYIEMLFQIFSKAFNITNNYFSFKDI